MSGISIDDDDPEGVGADGDGTDEDADDLEPWEAVFCAIAAVLSEVPIETQFAVVAALREPEPDMEKLSPEVRKVFEQVAEELFEEDDDEG